MTSVRQTLCAAQVMNSSGVAKVYNEYKEMKWYSYDPGVLNSICVSLNIRMTKNILNICV